MTQMPPQAPMAPQQGKDWLVTLLLCLFVGTLGVHRFYVGKTGTGIAMIFTLGGCGIWALIDLIMIITGSFKDAQGQPLVRK
jgi:TM2 domain-containing membrane protein YozV